MVSGISITGLTINNSEIIIQYTKGDSELNFKPNTKRGLVIGPGYPDDSLFIKPFEKGNIKWFYNYHTYVKGDMKAITKIIPDIEFVPKIWGRKSINSPPDFNTQYKSLMTFNEPFLPKGRGQSNLSISEIESYWTTIKSRAKGARIGLVSVTGSVTNMINDIKSLDIDYDFVELHIFTNTKNKFENTVKSVYNYTKKPIWITEFNCHIYDEHEKPSYRFCKASEQLAFMKSVLPYLEETPYIEKYAWFTTEPLKITSTNKADPLLSNVGGNYILTETGNFYNNYKYPE